MRKLFFCLFLLISVHSFSFGQNMQNIAGIGAQLIIDTAGGYTMPRIFSLVQNSPAYQSLRATDYIINVNDVSCKNKTIEEVVALIRGEAGSPVKMTTAGYKDGRDAKDTILIRVNMQVAVPQGASPDPVAAFYNDCEQAVNQLKKNKVPVIRTFNSDCGNYFFNFNADAGTYKVRTLTMDEKTTSGTPAANTIVKVYDGDNETGAIDLSASAIDEDKGTYSIGHYEGAITFSKAAVGVISIKVQEIKCRAMYIIVYR